MVAFIWLLALELFDIDLEDCLVSWGFLLRICVGLLVTTTNHVWRHSRSFHSTTFTIISAALSKSRFGAYWQNRGKFDQIVLLDDNSGQGMTDIPVTKALPRSHPLIIMKDALFKVLWVRRLSIIKSRILFRKGNYSNRYDMYVYIFHQ